jgi:Ca-activated chloride channel family protein
MVLFENSAFLAKPLNLVGKTNMVKIKEHIMDLHTQGGTNLYAGMQEGTRLFDDYLKADKTEYENRIIFLTDAMPNRELTNKNSLWGVMDENANKGIYATLIGVGVDFQTLLVEHISKVEGANYYSIHSGKEFRKRLDAEFEYMVTPLVFNLNLVVDTEGYEIMRVCGTPYSEESKGEIMKVGTLFPSPTEEGEVKGGIILVELKQLKKDGTIYLLAGYDDRKGEHFQNRVEVNFCEQLKNSKIITGLQKGVLLVHYADLLKEWTEYTRDPESGERKQQGIDDWQYKISPHKRNSLLNEWEQQSIPLSVDENYKSKFKLYKELLQNATQRFEDETFLQEVELLDFLINFDETEFQYSKQNINRLYGKTPKEAVHYDESPSKINEIPLQYPKFVRDCGIQGTVMLEIEILTDGNVGAVDVLKSVLPGPGGLDEAAVQYARGLKFEPAKTKGKPVAVWIKLPVEFSLD